MTDERRGLLCVFTGPGKGKTTAALGLALRAAGHELRVLFLGMLKGPPSGEQAYLKRERKIELVPMSQGYHLSPDQLELDRDLARGVWRRAAQAITGGGHDLLVLDDLCPLLSYDLLPLDDVLLTLRRRPSTLHVVATGRGAPEPLIELADLVTVMEARKHPFRQGVPPQPGIDF